VSHHIIFTTVHHVLKMPPPQHERKRVHAEATLVNNTFNNRVPQSGPPNRCWCVVSVNRRPSSRYDRLAPHFNLHGFRSCDL